MKKLSRYTIFKEVEDKGILFNTLTLGLLELNKEYCNKLKLTLENKAEYEDLNENLYKGSFLETELDERELMKHVHLNNKFQEKTLGLTIAPTLRCNFKCSYCYEEGVRYNTMNDETKELLIDFVKGYSKNIDSLQITWYGGEPLLEIETIEYLTKKFKEICNENNIAYNASIISNGYLLDETMALRLKELEVGNVQITLDGTQKVHDSRRMLINDEGTYERIMANICDISDIMKVSIRINIDKTNIDEADQILLELKSNGLNEKVHVYVAQVDDVNNAKLTSYCTLTEDFGEFELRFLNKALELGFDIVRLPIVNLSGCGALMKNMYVIDPLGNLYKCWNTIGRQEERIGKLGENLVITNNLLKWMNYNPFNNECNECIVQPLCMGGCPYQKQTSGQHKCNTCKYNLDDIVLTYYTEHKKK